MARLDFYDATGTLQSLDIGRGYPRVTIGRNPDCDISTTNPSVSRNHGEITLRAGCYLLVDHDSSNGTRLNSVEVRPHKLLVLQDGDTITCGEFELRFHDDGADSVLPAAVAALPPASMTPAVPDYPDYAPPPDVPVAPVLPEPVLPPEQAVGLAGRPEPKLPPPAVELGGGAPDWDQGLPGQERPSAVTGATSSRELGSLRARVAELESALQYYEEEAGDIEGLAEAKAEVDRLLEQRTMELEAERSSSAEVSARVKEMDAKLRRQEVEIENQLDKQVEVRKQIAHQAEQIDELRATVNERDHRIEDLDYQVKMQKEALEQHSAGLGDKAQEIADLKAENSQKARRVEELQRQLDITAYDLNQARDEVERITEISSGAGSDVDQLERKMANLRDVINVKDQQLQDKEEELRSALDELEFYREDSGDDGGARLAEMKEQLRRAAGEAEALAEENDALRTELEQAQAAAQEAGAAGGRERELVLQLKQLKRENRELRRQVDDLDGRLAEGSPGTGGGGVDEGAQRRIQLLEEENGLLEERIDRLSRKLSMAGGEGDPEALRELKGDNRKLRQRVDELEEALAEAKEGAAQAPGQGEHTEAVLGMLDEFNGLAAKIAQDMDSAAYNASELKRLVELLNRIDLSGLEPRDRRKLEMLMRDINPAETLDNMEQMMNSSVGSAKEVRLELRRARELLEV